MLNDDTAEDVLEVLEVLELIAMLGSVSPG
jgi:hypothetical protein